jgi:elongation factor P
VAIDTSDFKNGMAMYLDGEVYQLLDFQHVKPGKGGAFVRTRLKKLKTGAVLEKTFRAGERVEPAFVERKRMQFLYRVDAELVLMDLDSYEQTHVDEASIGPPAKYLKEEMEVLSVMADGEPIGYEAPPFVELEVVETDPGYKGDTVSGGATKPARLETGATVQVPFHVKEGDVVKIDTRTGAYLERVSRR